MAEHYYTPKLKNGFMGSGQKQFNRMSICDPDIMVQNASIYKNGVFYIAKYVLTFQTFNFVKWNEIHLIKHFLSGKFIWIHSYISRAYEIVEK